ncbi:hypothetical protein N7492_006602 [Penicillium capsulatum]|uniref:Rhodopsin domain-containing protein n=1 Tax=Penicillium capsulatum TaxID=69766 RepID=A0A9W9LKJ7_9EURO|nr:hypothetical protein N7492_006602 [Penicillium capsulatum]KAJ6116437.1 hypothetical protein N7512_006162 [Penicillium capsulatum]
MSTCQVPQANQSRVAPILAGVLGMLVLIMVSLRLIQRAGFNKLVGVDDGLIVMAFICAAPLNCLMFPMQKLGLGTNIWTIPFGHITKQLELLYVAEIFYMPAEALTQMSFLAFYLRIFPSKTFHRIAYVLMGLSACFGISNALVMIFQCTPVSFFWTGWTGETKGACIDINAYSWYKAAMQIAMDLSILSLPIWPLLQLSLNIKKKIQIVLMFGTGFLITVVSCLRLQSLVKFSKSTNVTYDNTPAIYWSVVECDVAIICACMPCLPSLLRNLFPSVFGPPSDKYYNNITPPQHGESSRFSVPLDRIKKDTTWQVTSSETNLVHGPGSRKPPQSA